MSYVYVVMAENGEYSNRNMWPAFIFMDEEKAKNRIVEEEKKEKQIVSTRPFYEETRYYCVKVEIIG